MPIYAFHCNDCSKDFETLVRSSDVPACPACDSQNLQQAVSKICVDIKYPAIAKSWRQRAGVEGHMCNVDKKELQGKP